MQLTVPAALQGVRYGPGLPACDSPIASLGWPEMSAVHRKKTALPALRRAERSRRFVPALALALGAAALGPAVVAADASTAPSTTTVIRRGALEVVTTVQLDSTILAAVGLQIGAVTTSAATPEPLAGSLISIEAPSFAAVRPGSLTLRMSRGGVLRGFAGRLRHHGGFRLSGAAGSYDFSALVLRPGARPTDLELLDAGGRALLGTAGAQWQLDAEGGQLRYLNADLRILPAFARRLGDPRLANVTVGALALDASFAPALWDRKGSDPCADWSGEVDVALIGMDAVGQAPGSTAVGGRVVVVPSVRLKNVGTANVPWYTKFSSPAPPYNNDQHPFLVWQMVREAGGVLEPLGRSDLKHAFATGNENCNPGACSSNSQILGRGCEDPYDINSNTWISALGPRAEVTASTGIWAHCNEPAPGTASHFDQAAPFCVQDFFGAGENAHTHGMRVAEASLQAPVPPVSPLRYFVEAFYVIRDDVNIFNTMGYRQVTPALSGSLWTFTFAAPYAQGPAINAWVNPAAPGPGADNRVLDTGQGRVQLAVRTTDLGAGKRRFAYALQNHDFDRRVDSFHVPFDTAGVLIENVAYVDGDAFADNDWTWTVDAGGITWTLPDTPPAAASPPAPLDFASLVSFRFDSDQAAAPALAELGAFEGSAPTQLSIQTLAPASGAPPAVDFYTLPPCRLLDTQTLPGGPAPIATGVAHVLDVVGVAACGVPSGAGAVALNVTVIGAPSAGEVALHSAGITAPPSVVAFRAGSTRANNAIVQLSLAGRLKIRPSLAGGGTVHLIVDVVGYLAPAP